MVSMVSKVGEIVALQEKLDKHYLSQVIKVNIDTNKSD